MTMSLHINNQSAKKRGTGKKLLPTIRAVMLEEHVDLVAGNSGMIEYIGTLIVADAFLSRGLLISEMNTTHVASDVVSQPSVSLMTCEYSARKTRICFLFYFRNVLLRIQTPTLRCS